jgi:AcrR family transcriptional regulator
MKPQGIRERKRQRTREAILRAARELFVAKGYHETSLAEIAERADIATSTLPGYFPTKGDILFEGIDEVLSDFIGCITSRDRRVESAIDATTRWHEGFAERLQPEGLEWWHQLSRITENDPVLAGQQLQRWQPGTDALAREIAADMGDSPTSLRPQMIAAIKAVMYVAHGAYAATASTPEEAYSVYKAWNHYTNECLRAAAKAIEDVPLPYEGITPPQTTSSPAAAPPLT